MKKESWQGIKGSLVYEDDKAIIVDETDDIKDTEKLSKQLAEKGQPIKEVSEVNPRDWTTISGVLL